MNNETPSAPSEISMETSGAPNPPENKNHSPGILQEHPEWAKGWMPSIMNWILTHKSDPPIFINPIDGKPQWINRAKRRKLARQAGSKNVRNSKE
jgi:hypothetical protein